MKRKWRVAFALFYTIVPVIGIKYGHIDLENITIFSVIYSLTIYPVVHYALEGFFKRKLCSVGVGDIKVIRYSFFALSLAMTILLLGLLMFNNIYSEGKSGHIGQAFLILLVFQIAFFTHTNHFITSLMIDVDHIVTSIRFSKGVFTWHEACEQSTLGMATIESDGVKASINKHGILNIQEYSKKEGNITKETETYLKELTGWSPVSPRSTNDNKK